MDWEEMYDVLRYVVGISEEALEIAFGVGGCTTETAERILFYKTGWNSFEQFLDTEEEGEDEDF